MRGKGDDFLIVKDNLHRHFIPNIVLIDGNKSVTPDSPPLSAIMRSELLKNKIT